MCAQTHGTSSLQRIGWQVMAMVPRRRGRLAFSVTSLQMSIAVVMLAECSCVDSAPAATLVRTRTLAGDFQEQTRPPWLGDRSSKPHRQDTTGYLGLPDQDPIEACNVCKLIATAAGSYDGNNATVVNGKYTCGELCVIGISTKLVRLNP